MSNVQVVGDKKGLEFGVLPGGYISHLNYKGIPYMRPQEMIDYGGEKGVKERNGTYPCFPNFGPPVEICGLPQHGWLKSIKTRVNPIKNGVEIPFVMGGFDNYPWILDGKLIYFLLRKNILLITMKVKRHRDDKCDNAAPINLAMHHYWRREKEGVEVMFFEKRKNIRTAQLLDIGPQALYEKAQKFEHPNFVQVKILGIEKKRPKVNGLVTMSVRGAHRPRAIVWTDHLGFLCVEQVADHHENFYTSDGMHLEKGKGNEREISFLLEFE